MHCFTIKFCFGFLFRWKYTHTPTLYFIFLLVLKLKLPLIRSYIPFNAVQLVAFEFTFIIHCTHCPPLVHVWFHGMRQQSLVAWSPFSVFTSAKNYPIHTTNNYFLALVHRLKAAKWKVNKAVLNQSVPALYCVCVCVRRSVASFFHCIVGYAGTCVIIRRIINCWAERRAQELSQTPSRSLQKS